jgi:hypothetical protein
MSEITKGSTYFIIKNSIFKHNQAYEGGAIYIEDPEDMTFSNNTIV